MIRVDISPFLPQEAQRNCDERGLTNVSLLLSDNALSTAGGTFDLVHTCIVLVVLFPWGPRLDAPSAGWMRKFGWMELGFQRTYFGEALMRCGFVVTLWMNPVGGLGNRYVARLNRGDLNLGECEVVVAVGDGGWYPAEGSHRWTSGIASIPLDPRWPVQTPPLMARQTPPGRTVSIMSCWKLPVRCGRRPL